MVGTRQADRQNQELRSTHFQYHVSGRIRIRTDDGVEFEVGPGDVTCLLSGHDAWVVGNEPVVLLDWNGTTTYAKQ